MGKLRDLTEQRFGRITVISRSPYPYISPKGKSESRWICRCDCGKEIVVTQSSLVCGRTRSCGCLQSEKVRELAQDITGKRFGRLIVLGPADIAKASNGTRLGWRCRCDCGAEIICTKNALISGDTKSCGCLHSEKARARLSIEEENAVGHFDGTTISLIKPERPANKNSKSGIKGVSWNKSKGKWVATMRFKNKQMFLGAFSAIEDAIKARKAAEEKYFQPTIERYEELKKNEKDH